METMQWEEPEVAMPTAAYTGHPMEEIPESMQKRRRRPEEVAAEKALRRSELQLDTGLKTQKTEAVRQDSGIRNGEENKEEKSAGKPPRRSSRRHTLPVDYRERPPSPLEPPGGPPPPGESGQDSHKSKKPRLRRTRRTKPSQVFGTLGSQANGAIAADSGDAATEKKHKPESRTIKSEDKDSSKDFCNACGGMGELICCEKCSKRFHLLCVDPPLSEESLPSEAWYCNECTYKRQRAENTKAAAVKTEEKDSTEPKLTIKLRTVQGQEKDKKASKKKRKESSPGAEAKPEPPVKVKKEESLASKRQRWGLFGELLEQAERRNPRVFRLPRVLQLRYEGVMAGEDGDYVNEFELPPKKPRDREDNLRLERADGQVILCFKCSESALKGPLITCEKCSSHWHVDCLDPPQFNLPARWVCPNHAENAAKLPRRLRKQRVRDTVLRRGHKNNGLIEVYDDEEPLDPATGTPIGLVGSVVDSDKGFVAKMARPQRADEIVRLPAREIKLDFIDFVHARWQDPWRETKESRIINVLDDIAQQPQPEREATRNLAYLKLQGTGAIEAAIAKKNMEQLVQVALNDNDDQQVLAIRKLMQVKGPSKLLEFLNS